MGQQSLPIFILGSCLSFMGGVLLEGRNANLLDSAIINIAGIGFMLLIAQLLNWLDQKPWKNVTQKSGRSMNTDWPKQAILACGIVFLTIVPLLFLQSQSTDMSMATAPIPEPDLAINGVEDLTADPQILDTEDVAFQPEAKPIEQPDSF
jgi:hypothetical protein